MQEPINMLTCHQVVRDVNCNLSKCPMAFRFFHHHFKKTANDGKYLVNTTPSPSIAFFLYSWHRDKMVSLPYSYIAWFSHIDVVPLFYFTKTAVTVLLKSGCQAKRKMNVILAEHNTISLWSSDILDRPSIFLTSRFIRTNRQ